MNTKKFGLFAVAIAIVAVGALAYGVPLQQVALLGVFLACPLMMFLMMRGMGGGADQEKPDPQSEPVNPATTR